MSSLAASPLAPASRGLGGGGLGGGGGGARSARGSPPLQVGMASVLQWWDVLPEQATLAFAQLPLDRVTPFLVTSRDGGVTADLSAIYAGQPLIPHSQRGQAEPRESTQPKWTRPANQENPKAREGADYDFKPFDWGYIQPASELLTVHSGHRLYYEGRPVSHAHRFDANATIAMASWPLHRLTALVRLPGCATPVGLPPGLPRRSPGLPPGLQPMETFSSPSMPHLSNMCGGFLTRPFMLPSAALELNLDCSARSAARRRTRAGGDAEGAAFRPNGFHAAISQYKKCLSADLQAGLSGGTVQWSPGDARESPGEVLVEVLRADAPPHAAAIPGLGAADAEPARGSSLRARLRWRSPRGRERLAELVGSKVRLRFWLCGGARLYAFTFAQI